MVIKECKVARRYCGLLWSSEKEEIWMRQGQDAPDVASVYEWTVYVYLLGMKEPTQSCLYALAGRSKRGAAATSR